MGEALVHAVGNGPIVVEGGKYLFNRMKYVVQAIDIKKCFLLSGERGIRQSSAVADDRTANEAFGDSWVKAA